MNLEPNFPSAIPLTEEELAEVLTEFHRRGRSEVKHLAPPPPFEVTSSIVQTTSSRKPVDLTREDPELVVQPQALIAYEKNFDFEFTAISGEQSGWPLWLYWNFRCHDEGTVADESYIRLYPGSYWQSANPPGYSGQIRFSFNRSTWTPPAFDQVGAPVYVELFALNFPIQTVTGTHINIYEAYMYFAMYVQKADDQQQFSDNVYAVGNPNPAALRYYQATNGIGIILQFHGEIR